jgi:hypothetical protein
MLKLSQVIARPTLLGGLGLLLVACGSSAPPVVVPGCIFPDAGVAPGADAAAPDMALPVDGAMASDMAAAPDAAMAVDAMITADATFADDTVLAPPEAGAPPPLKAGMRVGTNLWGLEWGIWNDIFQPNVDFATTANPWRQAFLDEVSHYGAIRYMDFQRVNNSTEQHWNERTQKYHPAAQQQKLAYEWMIDLSNRTKTDMWISIPHLADDEYVHQLAALIYSTLSPSLRVYVEWSNETWNGDFSQTQYAYDRGNAMGLDTDAWGAAFRYHVYAAVRVWSQFEQVFGKNSPRLVKVLGGEIDNTWITQHHIDALADRMINPEGITADAYAIAPYFGDGVNWNGPDPVNQLSQSIKTVMFRVQQQAAVVSKAGLQLVAYEGGQHVRENADVVNAQPEMYQLYTSYLDGLAPSMGLFMHYCHNGEWNGDRAWGAEQSVGQPLSQAHKLRALFDWIAAHK